MKTQQIVTLVGLVAVGTAIGVAGARYNNNKVAKTLEMCNSGDTDTCYKVKDKSLIVNPDYHYKQKLMKTINLARDCKNSSETLAFLYCDENKGLDTDLLAKVNPELLSEIESKVVRGTKANIERKKRLREYNSPSKSAYRDLMSSESQKTVMVWRCDDAIRPQLKDPRSFERIDATFVPSVVQEAPGQVVDVRINFRSKNSFGGYAGGFGRCGFDKDAKLVKRPRAVNTW